MFSRFTTRHAHDAPASNGALPVPDVLEAPRPTEKDEQLSRWLDLKTRLHERLLEELNLAAIEKVAKPDLRREVAALVNELLTSEGTALNAKEFGLLIDDRRLPVRDRAGVPPARPRLAPHLIALPEGDSIRQFDLRSLEDRLDGLELGRAAPAGRFQQVCVQPLARLQ